MEEQQARAEVFRVSRYLNEKGEEREEYTHQAPDGYVKRFTDQQVGTALTLYGIQLLLGFKVRYEIDSN
jgi:hypothetical protein